MKIRVALLVMTLALLMSGCDNRESNKENGSGYNKGDEIIEMTDEEITLLCGFYVNEDRIREGKLHDYQKETLDEFRMAKSYLQEKYPGYTYDFFSISPSDKTQSYTKVEFTIDESSGYYSVMVELLNGEYVVTDNFYGYVLGAAFDEMLEQKLSEAGLTDFGVHAGLSGFVGKDIDANTTMDELLALGSTIKIDITVWIDMPGLDENENQKKVALIESTVRELEIYGGHIVYFGEGVVNSCHTFDDFVEYRKKNSLESVSFNTFDMR